MRAIGIGPRVSDVRATHSPGATALLTSMTLFAGGCLLDEPQVRQPRLSATFDVVEHRVDPGVGEAFAAVLTLTNTGQAPLGAAWTFYFNFQRTIVPESVPPQFSMRRINGDFQSLEPTDLFAGLSPGESTRISFEGLGQVPKLSDAPAGAYLVLDGADADPLPTEVAVGSLAPAAGGHPPGRPADIPLVPTPASRYQENTRVSLLPAEGVGLVVPAEVTPEVDPKIMGLPRYFWERGSLRSVNEYP